jgi:TupA-like ATPgrasp
MSVLKQFRRKLGLNRGSLLARLPLHWQYVLRYYSRHKDFNLLLKPKTFNQKLFYKMLYDRRPLLVTFADKLAAREYVRQKVGGEILVNLLAVTDRPEEIRFDLLPERFVIKANHGSGFVRIVKNKRLEDEADLRRTCQKWLSKSYGEWNGEWVYYKSIPPKIMIESFLDSGQGEAAYDYKFFVFNGKVFMIQVDMDRFIGHRRDLFTREWKFLDVRYRLPNSNKPVSKPACLDQMIKIAERLAEETDFVRVDLYEVGGRIFFGELTNFPLNGGQPFEPKEFDAVLGAQWRIEGYGK